jgi:superfamily I DNA/RNA helicase
MGPPQGAIVLLTAHSAKGLEFRCVHLPFADGVKSFELQRKLAYTMVTRAKTDLSIYYRPGKLPGYWEQAIADALTDQAPPKPSMSDLLKGTL